MTPEMFAEYRAPECPGCYGNQGHNYPCPATKTPLHREKPSVTGARGRWTGNKFGKSWLPPGPAFIYALPGLERRTTDLDFFRRAYGVPDGYIWQPSTDYTGAGWVRPHGSV